MTQLSEQAFDELERVGGASLNAEHRRRIERALQRYERQRRAQPKTHKLAAALAKSLEQSIGLINRMQDEHPRTWQRHGPFLDFLFSAQGHLPSDLRQSKGAIGAAWQRICAAREKGDFVEIDISQPKVFELVMSRRRIKPSKRRGR
jgi:hypothetical protein